LEDLLDRQLPFSPSNSHWSSVVVTPEYEYDDEYEDNC